MRILGLIGLTLVLSACANERTITFLYYPNRPFGDTFPPPSQFYAEAGKECAKYGLVAVHDWDNWTDWQRVRTTFRCYQPG